MQWMKAILLSGVLALQLATAQAAPTITVDKNPVMVAAGQNAGDATITWDAENNPDAEVWMQVNDGKETQFSDESQGVEPATIRVGRKYTFRLYSHKRRLGPIKNPLAKMLASVQVSAITSGSASPPRSPDRTPPGTIVPAEWPGGVKFPAPAPEADARYAPSTIYAIRPDGLLGWFRHDGANVGTSKWEPPRLVERNFADYKQVLAGGGGDIYTIGDDGVLRLHRHVGFATGLNMDNADGWLPSQQIATGWNKYKQVFAGGGGVIYAIAQNNNLHWYKNGAGGLEGPREIGSNWGNFKQVFGVGQGIIYALDGDGKLVWYRHAGYADGAKTWADYKTVAENWGQFTQIFGAGTFTTGNPAVDGAVIYAVTKDGKLMWYKHRGFRDGSAQWWGNKEVGSGWNDFKQVFALMSATPADQSSVYNPNAPKALNLNPFIKYVRVYPGTSDVKISFSSTQKAAPAIVEIGDVAPTLNRNKEWVWPTLSNVFSRFVTGQNGNFDLNLTVDGNRLEANKTYFYVIKVFNDDKNASRKLDQFTSKFTTQDQTVRIVWESVHISNDSDPNGAGEIDFRNCLRIQILSNLRSMIRVMAM